MTSGERAIWAAAFERALADGRDFERAAEVAAGRVRIVREMSSPNAGGLSDRARSMLVDMTSTGADR